MENTNKKIWNDIKCDLVAGVTSFSQCMTMGDVSNEGDNKLICGDIGFKLKVFKQECLVSETKLQFSPVSIVCYKAVDPNFRSIMNFLAVAGGSSIYTYHNMKGKYKLPIPNIEINSLEQQLWDDLKNSKIENSRAIEKLKDMASQSKFN